MERARSTAVSVFLCVALLAAACSGDDGGATAPDPPTTTLAPTTTTTASTTTTTVADPPDEPRPMTVADALRGAPKVQDVAVHLGMWVERDDGVESFLASVVDTAVPVGDAIELADGMTLQPVAGLDGRVLDADGDEIPGLSSDFALLSATPGENTDLIDELVANAEGEGAEDVLAALADDAQGQPLLVEVITAEPDGLNHVGSTDRSVVDITVVDQIQPGDSVAMEYLFAQTLPDAPDAEVGLSPIELFAHRWDQGFVRFLGDDGVAAPFLDTAVEVREGSTLLDRHVKAAILVQLDLALERPDTDQVWDSLVKNRAASSPGTASFRTTFTIPGSDVPGIVTGDVEDGQESFAVHYLGEIFTMDSKAEMTATVRLLAARARCVVLATVARELNEAASSPDPVFPIIDSFPSVREQADPPLGVEIIGEGEVDDSAPELPLLTPYFDPPEDDDEPPPPPGCEEPGFSGELPPSPGGIAYGDVRITTIDGVVYTNNAAGEFILYDDDSTIVQVRLEPWADGTIGVSVATAAGLAVDGHEVSLHLDGGVWVDGEPVELERGVAFDLGGGELVSFGDRWLAITPDGTVIRVDKNLFSLVITVEPAAGGRSVGLFGDGDGDPEGDLVRRDGTPFDGDPRRLTDRIYPEFIETWRIAAAESLFHYDDGESNETFTIEGFPEDEVVVGSLSEEDRVFGEQACRTAGVFVDGPLFDSCVIDVAVTGEPALALDSFDALLMVAEREIAAGDSSVPAPAPGDTILAIGDEILVFGHDPPNQRPRGIQATWNCQITDGDLFADGRIDLADGPPYSITVQYLASEPRLTLILTTPNEEGVTSNYAWVETRAPHFADAVDTMTIEGERFTARGELYVNESFDRLAPGSELPDGATFDPFTLDLDCTS
ncbi:MAG: VWD domain-containing protein [Acidimicrobiales bacterium]|nr:VWD domain-containing protein [Acidimicrobiales bacterium]